MKGKLPLLALLVCLAAFGYLFLLNPTQVNFRLFQGPPLKTNLALIVFLSFLSGFCVAFLSGLGKETLLSLRSWRQRRREERREQGRKLFAAGRGLLAVAKPKAARKALSQAYRRLPGDSAVALDLARAEAAQGLAGAAEMRLKALLEDDPRNLEALSFLLELQRGRDDRDGQAETLARWIEVDPGHLPSLRALRDLYRRSGKWPEAVRVQETVLAKSDGREVRSAERRVLSEVLVLGARGAPSGAAQAGLRRAVEEDPTFAPGYAALGDFLAEQGDAEGACRVWVKGYEATTHEGLLLKAEEIRVRQGRGEEQLKYYRKRGKKETPLVLLRARLLILLDRPDEALDLLEGLEGAAGTCVAARWLLGEALLRLRSYERSAKAFRGTAGPGEEGISVPFVCSGCGASAPHWGPSCSACGALGSLRMNLGRTAA